MGYHGGYSKLMGYYGGLAYNSMYQPQGYGSAGGYGRSKGEWGTMGGTAS